jgi:hypothetical protein
VSSMRGDERSPCAYAARRGTHFPRMGRAPTRSSPTSASSGVEPIRAAPVGPSRLNSGLVEPERHPEPQPSVTCAQPLTVLVHRCCALI